MLLEIVVLFVMGLVIGGLARLALPGPDPMGLLTTAAVGIVGALASGLIVRLAFHRVGWSFVIAFVISVLIVYIMRRARGGRVSSGPSRYYR